MLIKTNRAKITRNLSYLVKDLEQFGFTCRTAEVEVGRHKGLQLHVEHRGQVVLAANLLAGGPTGATDWATAKQEMINVVKAYGLEALESPEPV